MEGLKPTYQINYQGKDVTGDFAPLLKRIEFRDYLDGKAGEIEIELEDKKGLFLGDWYPDIDDRIEVMMGFDAGEIMRCGLFWVDEVRIAGGSEGNSCSIRCLSLPSSAIISPVSRVNYEAKLLQEIVSQEASKLGYKAVGDLSGTWSGLQTESGLAFINRIAHETGRILKLEDKMLVFYKLSDVLQAAGAIEIDAADVSSFDVSDKASGRISKCTIKWWDRKKKKQIEGSYDAGIKGGGNAIIWQEVDDVYDAQKRAKDYVTDRNKKGLEFTLLLLGDVRLRAGVPVKVTGFGRFDTLYYIGDAKHTISEGGYTTSVTLQKLTTQ